ncbi:chemotaxis protein CheW [Azonexus caeni]|jgi:two-component system chemotaxis sensor kinase CheA|uniref:chemotaxis protein CheW n=1 Tax=Azonexus caeni TaxID=266126 RepID=UPI003A89CD4C
MSIDMSQFYQVFFEESEEHLAAMESLLLALDVAHPDAEQLNAIFRAAHSIKGSAGTFGFSDLAETTHILENLLDRIRKGDLALRPEMVDACLQAGDVLHSMLDTHQGRGSVDQAAVDALCQRLRQLSDGNRAVPATVAAIPEPAPLATDTAAPVATRTCYEIGFVPTAQAVSGVGLGNLLDELRKLGELEIVQRPLPEGSIGQWLLRLTTAAVRDSFADQVDFVAESGAWYVGEAEPAAADDADFGIFADAPGAPPVEAYGFFEPLPVQKPAEEDPGYGFFEPLPAPVEAPPVAEGGEGFGFFAPLPAPPVVAEIPASEAAVETKSLPAVANGEARQKAPPANAANDSSIRVSVEKVDQLINLVGELVITQAMLLQTSSQMLDAAPERLVTGLAQLERNTRDLQEAVMSIRMLPISFVFSRFPRVIRDLSAKLGKQVELKTMGETTELDKGLIERIADPLTHLIRNSLDHGIESPERRIAAGKSPVGTITLKAYHQGGNIVIEVGDDGAGLPRDKILAKARERGLPVSDQMSDQEVFNLIFEAGFSTAEQVTDVSGRGVGMDVVRRNIQSMGGRVEIDSMAGIGTRMTVRLPLTLAILDGMSVAVGDQIYILPLSYVLESLQPTPGEIRTLSNQARVVQVRGEYLPVLVLHEMFKLQSVWNDFTQGIMVVLDADGIRVALFVDALLGQHQVVIKSLEANYRKVPGISGATIMGDGHVALILDVSAIATMARNHLHKADAGPLRSE